MNKESNETECYNADALKERRCNFSDDSETTKDYHSGKLGESNSVLFIDVCMCTIGKRMCTVQNLHVFCNILCCVSICE